MIIPELFGSSAYLCHNMRKNNDTPDCQLRCTVIIDNYLNDSLRTCKKIKNILSRNLMKNRRIRQITTDRAEIIM